MTHADAPVAALACRHRWQWQANSEDLTHGKYVCACGATRQGALNFNSPQLRGTDLSAVPFANPIRH